MAKLTRIANIVVSLRTTGIAQLSFSDAMALGVHNISVDRRLIITGADELLEMGLSMTDKLYAMAKAWFSQIPSTRQLYIGRQTPGNVKFSIGTVAEGHTYTLKAQVLKNKNVVQYEATHTATDEDTSATVATALAALTAAWPIDALAAAADVTFTAENGSEMVITASGTGNITTTLGAPVETVEQALAASNGNWYGLLLTSRAEADVKAAAEWTEANEKLFLTATDDVNCLISAATSDLMSWAKGKQMFRTAIGYSSKAQEEYPEAALMSNRFTYYPGAETWANVKLSGVSYDELQEGEARSVDTKNGWTFEPFRNFAITQFGKVAGGEWIDVIRFRDWLAEECRVRVVSAIINADGKIPYTDVGIATIGNALTGALDLGVRRGGIAPPEKDELDNTIPSYVLTLPKSASVAFNDKANRVLNDVKGTARLAGAIHVVNANISLSYEL